MYEYENQILNLRNGRSIFSGATFVNQTDTENTTTRFLQSESQCNDYWASYVQSGIEGEIMSIIPLYETLNVVVENVTRGFNVEEKTLILFLVDEVFICALLEILKKK